MPQFPSAVHDDPEPRSDDDFVRWLNSRLEGDEPLTPDEQAALIESDADIARGRTVSFEETKRQIGDQAR
jgi:hypothetical protein